MSGLLLFVLVLSSLIVVHEWGHFIVARFFGIRVERFSVGFGPVLLRRTFGETEYCLSLIPLGGYVKMAGESTDEAQGHPWEFQSKPSWQRFAVVLAGPLLNAITAFVLFFAVFSAGIPVPTSRIGQVMPDYPAAQSGLAAGDRIVAVNGTPVHLWEELLFKIAGWSEGPIQVRYERAGEFKDVTIEPRWVEHSGGKGEKRRVARLGVMPSDEKTLIQYDPLKSVVEAFRKLVILTELLIVSLGMIATGAVPIKDSMTGPIGIYFMTQEAYKVGWTYVMNFAGTLSVSLFVLNLLPIPVLDGGHLFILGIEAVIRRRISEKIKAWMTQAGFSLLLIFMVFVIYQDVMRFQILQKLLNLLPF